MSFFITLMLGAFYRLQFAGYHFNFLNNFNLHQAHTHMGFYGALAGLVIAHNQTPTRQHQSYNFIFYTVVLFISVVGFFWDGYNVLTKVLSFIIFLTWLYESFNAYLLDSSDKSTSSWTQIAFYSLFIAALFLALIVFHKTIPYDLPVDQLVKSFLLTLLAGYFTPNALNKIQIPAPRTWYWITFLLVSGFGLLLLPETPFSSLGLSCLGLSIIKNTITSGFSHSPWPKIIWIIHSSLLILFNFFYNSHNMAIAGIHFWILGPIMTSLFNFSSKSTLGLYSAITMLFAMSIGLLDIFFITALNLNLMALQLSIAILGFSLSILVFLDFLMGFKFKDFLFQKNQ